MNETWAQRLNAFQKRQLALPEAKARQHPRTQKEIDAEANPPEFEGRYGKNADGLIDRVIGWAKAIGTNPVDAFDKLMKDETFARMENGQIIVLRRDKTEPGWAEKERKLLGGGGKEVKLDHIKPLEIGGDNSRDNLRLVTTEQWERYSPIENMLGQALHNGQITGPEAQKLIVAFKSDKITANDVRARLGIAPEADTGMRDDTRRELNRLDLTSGVADQLKVGEVKTKLSKPEYKEYKNTVQTRVQQQLDRVMQTDTYKNADDTRKKIILQSVIDNARNAERARIKGDMVRQQRSAPPPQ